MKAKMGARMHQNAPNCSIFQKKFRGSMPPDPSSMALHPMLSDETIFCLKNCAPPPPHTHTHTHMEFWICP